MANGDHRQVTIVQGDTVVLSASPDPGQRAGCLPQRRQPVQARRARALQPHRRTSTCAATPARGAEDHPGLVQPEYFVPIHGEYRHMVLHARLAESMGVPKGNAFVLTDGDVLEIDEARRRASRARASELRLCRRPRCRRRGPRRPARPRASRDRRHGGRLRLGGQADGQARRPPEVLSRGFVDVEEREDAARTRAAGRGEAARWRDRTTRNSATSTRG